MAESTPPEILRNLSTLEEVEARAFKRGQDAARTEARLGDHEQRLREHERLIDAATVELRGTREAIGRLGEEFRQSVVVAATRGVLAKESAERQVSTRTFVLGLIGASCAVIAIVLGVGR